MVLIKVMAAVLLLVGSGFIFHALLALEPPRPRLVSRPTLRRLDRDAPDSLRRAA